MVLVNGKPSEKFFDAKPEHKSLRNIEMGTVISEQVVGNNYDFFLNSQRGNFGTIVPTHYEVIYTNSKMEEGLLQQLIYHQCFGYANWTGSIKFPAVLQYAKKCSKFHSEVAYHKVSDLSNRLYFIWWYLYVKYLWISNSINE